MDILKELEYFISTYSTEMNGVVPIRLLKKVKEELESLKCNSYKTSWKAKFLEAKAEIERLTERKEFWESMHDKVCNQFENLEDRIEEYENTIEMKVFRISELQKQLDELKEQRDVFKRLFESVNTSNLSTNSIIETMNTFYREQAQHLAELKIEQAVKDTAKEIYCEINSCIEQGQEYCGLDWRGLLTAKNLLLVYCKKKGLGVE